MFEFEFQSNKTPMAQLKGRQAEEVPPCSQKDQPFCSNQVFQPGLQRMDEPHLHCYIGRAIWFAQFTPEISWQTHPECCLTKCLGTLWSSQADTHNGNHHTRIVS